MNLQEFQDQHNDGKLDNPKPGRYLVFLDSDEDDMCMVHEDDIIDIFKGSGMYTEDSWKITTKHPDGDDSTQDITSWYIFEFKESHEDYQRNRSNLMTWIGLEFDKSHGEIFKDYFLDNEGITLQEATNDLLAQAQVDLEEFADREIDEDELPEYDSIKGIIDSLTEDIPNIENAWVHYFSYHDSNAEMAGTFAAACYTDNTIDLYLKIAESFADGWDS